MIDVLIEKFDMPEEVLPKKLDSLSSLNLSGENISNLTGIEYALATAQYDGVRSASRMRLVTK